MITTKTLFVVALLATTAVTSAFAEDSADDAKITFSTGFDYTSGDYGATTDTDITSVPLSLKYEESRWNAKVSLPYVSIKGAGGVRPDTGVVGANAGARNRNSGFGDLSVSGTFTAIENLDEQFYLDLTGKVKIPTANEDKQLGTGEFDYTAQVDLTKVFGNITPMLGGGYKWLGDSATLQLDNVWFWSAGVDYRLSDKTHLGGFFDWREAATATSEHQKDASIYISHRLNQTLKVQPYIGTGFSDGSPDFNAGLSVSIRLN